jgi:hypothetical protein
MLPHQSGRIESLFKLHEGAEKGCRHYESKPELPEKDQVSSARIVVVSAALVYRVSHLARPEISRTPIRLNREETVEVGSQDVEVKQRHRVSSAHHSGVGIEGCRRSGCCVDWGELALGLRLRLRNCRARLAVCPVAEVEEVVCCGSECRFAACLRICCVAALAGGGEGLLVRGVGGESTGHSRSRSNGGFCGGVAFTVSARSACDGLLHCPNHAADRRAGVEDWFRVDHAVEAVQAFVDVFQVVGVFGRMPQAVVEQHGAARFDEEGCESRVLGLN